MNFQRMLMRRNLLNWSLVCLGGWFLTIYYTIIKGWLSLYGGVLVRVFTNVTDKEGKLYLLYLGYCIAGANWGHSHGLSHRLYMGDLFSRATVPVLCDDRAGRTPPYHIGFHFKFRSFFWNLAETAWLFNR